MTKTKARPPRTPRTPAVVTSLRKERPPKGQRQGAHRVRRGGRTGAPAGSGADAKARAGVPGVRGQASVNSGLLDEARDDALHVAGVGRVPGSPLRGVGVAVARCGGRRRRRLPRRQRRRCRPRGWSGPRSERRSSRCQRRSSRRRPIASQRSCARRPGTSRRPCRRIRTIHPAPAVGAGRRLRVRCRDDPALGYQQKYNGRAYNVYDAGEDFHWTLGWPVNYTNGTPCTILINRKPITQKPTAEGRTDALPLS